MDENRQKIASLDRGYDVAARGNAAVIAHNLHISGGNFSSAGRDYVVHNHHCNHTTEAPKIDLMAALDSVDNHRAIQQDTLDKRTAKTGEWIFDHDVFPGWRDLKSSVKTVWGTGILGAGKSVLISIIIDYFETLARQENICVGYIYIRYSDMASLTLRHCLEVLVKQTVEKHPACFKLAEGVYAEHLRLKTRPTDGDLVQLLKRFTKMVARTFYFLDALDEASTKIQLGLLKALATLDAKVFITSRPLLLLATEFPEAHHFEIAAQDSDIELHINKEIEGSLELRRLLQERHSSWRKEIVTSIKDKCGGMFLHASLQVAALKKCCSVHDVQKTLEHFPRRIEDFYKETWKRLIDEDGDADVRARKCLLWVVGATRSMSVNELRHAVATCLKTQELDRNQLVAIDTLVSSTRGLLVVDEQTQLVRLIHYTAKDVLERLILETSPDLQSLLASFCMSHLIKHGFQRWESGHGPCTPQSNPLADALKADCLLSYAYWSWSIHAMNVLNDSTTYTQVENFIRGCQGFPGAISTNCESHSRDEVNLVVWLNPLRLVAYFDLPVNLAQSKQLRELNIRASDAETSLLVACSRNSLRTANELLALPQINVNTTTQSKDTPLAIASCYGLEAMAELLLSHPKVRLDLANECGHTPLHCAALGGHEGVVKLLLAASRSELHLVDKGGRTPLHTASGCGQEGIVELLLSASQSEVHLGDSHGRTPLGHAAANGYEGVVKLLLAASLSEVHSRESCGQTPLSVACDSGHRGVAKLLLTVSRAEIHHSDNFGQTPLSYAARRGDEALIGLLLAVSTDELHLENMAGQTPLIIASQSGSEDALKRLLAASQNEIHMADNYGRVPLSYASERGHLGMVILLLAVSRGEIHWVDVGGRTALSWASGSLDTPEDGSSHNTSDAVSLLLAFSDAELNTPDVDGFTPLIWAIKNDRVSAVKVLLNHPASEVNLGDRGGWTALIWALQLGYTHLVKLILADAKTDPNVVDARGRTALAWACREGHEEAVELLLAHAKIDVNLTDAKGRTPLTWACKAGEEEVVELLLAHANVDVNLGDANGQTPLAWAYNLKEARQEIVELLLSHSKIERLRTVPIQSRPTLWTVHLLMVIVLYFYALFASTMEK